MVDFETIVVGGGAMGSAAAWQLARRGVEVVLLERFGPGHRNGASHGASRNFNVAYAEADYLGLLDRALPLWRELEAEARTELLQQVGIVNHGRTHAHDAVHAALVAAGIPSAFVPLAEAAERWPGIRADGRVLWTPTAGRLHADRAVAALQRAAADSGAQVRHNTRVISIEPHDDHVLVEVMDGDSGAVRRLRSRTAVVTVGAWTQKLLDGRIALPRLVVTQEQPAHFALRDGSFVWPGFNHTPAPGEVDTAWWPSPIYGMQTPGEGIKAGWHGVGPVTDPDERSFRSEPTQLAQLRRYVAEWLPGADPDAVTEISCTYTTTPDSDFVLDRVGQLIVGAGFSGHGFKFTPAVGEVLADLATAAPTAVPERFRLGPRAAPRR
ncbi:FAD-dependent oxidoreductase [Microbacteriaceae bacterium VKM Ac-2854]|nr:FAD-dependent oxidoreductase [Microbacteriaceae bacterium VKM Ac-2854]